MLRYLASIFALTLASCLPAEAPDDEGVAASGAASASSAADSSSVGPSSPAGEGPIVVFLGTSLTAGLGLSNDDDTYVARVAELAEAAGMPLRAVNAGVSGETSAGGLRRLDWVLRQPLDVLVVELGANDGLRGQDPDALARNLTEIIRRTRTRHPGVRVVLAGMEAPPNLGPRYTSAFREVFPAVAAEADVTLIPFLLEGVAGVPELNQDDGIHPTAEGHRLLARNVWRVLEPVLADAGVAAGG